MPLTNKLNDELAKLKSISESVKLFISLNSYKRDDSPCTLDTSCIFLGLNILYQGTSNVIRSYLEKNNDFLATIYSSPKPLHYKSVLVTPVKYPLYKDYIKFIHNNIDNNLCITYTPKKTSDILTINTITKTRIQKWYGSSEKFYDSLRHNFSPVELSYNSFLGNGGDQWLYKFDKSKTKLRAFVTEARSDDPLEIDSKEVMMMSREGKPTFLYSFNDTTLNCLFVDIPYKNRNSMLIIKPHTIMKKDEILSFCFNYLSDGCAILDFYNKNKTKIQYDNVYLPKFHIKSQCHLDRRELFTTDRLRHLNENYVFILNSIDLNYLDKFFHNTPDFDNMFDKSHDTICDTSNQKSETRLSCFTEFICNERGTLLYDSYDDNFESFNNFLPKSNETLDINTNFIFAVMNKDKFIQGMGIFIGKEIKTNDAAFISAYDTITIK